MESRNCIRCGVEIEPITHGTNTHVTKPESAMWNGGIVDKVTAGYGSDHDMNQFIIAICDECIKDGSVQFAGRVKFG